ncbi:MAG: undecaprenyl-diphosphate phosphatase, partial [Flavobacteriales bacterium]|nr:undecaprenyl-diphosphate phosphatase [Flavobacteriales bacterium]
MEIINAIILGIIQGLTEFLPVSSSGHLEIAKAILGEGKVGGESMLMTVVLHFATALSTIFIFRKDLISIFGGLFQFKNNESFQFSLKIVLSMIPAALVGVFFNDEIEALFGGALTLVGVMLLLTGLLLFMADKAKASEKNVGIKDAILIGISQAIAILPGISRSGATISTSVLLGIDKEKSARFSFLMVVPLIFGKMAKDILSGGISTTDTNFLPLIIGFIFAFFTGMFACKWMIKLVKNSQLKYFAYYCFAIGG